MVFIHLAWSRPAPCLPPSLAFLHFLNYGCDPYLSYFQNKQSIAGKDETKSTLCTKRSFIFLMFYLIRVLRLWFQWGESTVQLKRRLKSLKNKLASTKKRKKMKSQWECLLKMQCANSKDPSTEVETDYPSKYEDKMIICVRQWK